ncbi:MAG: hypothetical protein VSS75_007790 [Candidatus Parabeggiatoa sp.]|nr:hypothetical protein [Candidatus Parabeggiatoa sp.]
MSFLGKLNNLNKRHFLHFARKNGSKVHGMYLSRPFQKNNFTFEIVIYYSENFLIHLFTGSQLGYRGYTMKKNQFSITFKGSLDDDEHLRLSDFVNQLGAFKTVLGYIDSSINQQSQKSTYYRVIDLSHSSPACVVLEAVPLKSMNDNTHTIIHQLFRGLQDIISGRLPHDYNDQILQSLKKIVAPRMTEIKLSYDNEDINIPLNLAAKIDSLLGPDEVIEESMTGTLEMLDIHAPKNKFRIYPVIGPKKVDCYFSVDLLQKAIDGVSHYVNVEGEFKYKSSSPFPYAVDVTDIEIYPDEDELPTLFNLQGIAPNATGQKRSEDFVRGIRDNEW